MSSTWLSALVLVTAAILSSLSAAEAKHASPQLKDVTPSAAASSSTCTCCPDVPTFCCDFYFDTYTHRLPTFHLNDGILGDHVVSPNLLKALNWRGWSGYFSPSIRDVKTGQLISVFSSWKNGTFLQCPKAIPKYINPGGQFYVGGSYQWAAKLYARRFQRATPHQHGRHFYENRCVLLYLADITIPTSKGNIKLKDGDGNQKYPEDRRCIVFKTSK